MAAFYVQIPDSDGQLPDKFGPCPDMFQRLVEALVNSVSHGIVLVSLVNLGGTQDHLGLVNFRHHVRVDDGGQARRETSEQQDEVAGFATALLLLFQLLRYANIECPVGMSIRKGR